MQEQKHTKVRIENKSFYRVLFSRLAMIAAFASVFVYIVVRLSWALPPRHLSDSDAPETVLGMPRPIKLNRVFLLGDSMIKSMLPGHFFGLTYDWRVYEVCFSIYNVFRQP